MALELNSIGGTNYLSTLTSTLLTDTSVLVGALREEQIKAGIVAKQFDKATSAGATVPSTVSDKLAVAKCLTHVPGGMQTLRQIELLLTCKLGVHKSYPQ